MVVYTFLIVYTNSVGYGIAYLRMEALPEPS